MQWDVPVPLVTTGDGLYKVAGLYATSSFYTPVSILGALATIDAIGTWSTGPTVPNYSSLASSYQLIRSTACSVEIVDYAPIIGQGAQIYVGTVPGGAWSANGRNIYSTTPNISLVASSESDSKLFASWYPLSPTPIDWGNIANDFKPTGLVYHPVPAVNIYDSNPGFFAFAPAALGTDAFTVRITLHYEAIPYIGAGILFNPTTVIGSSEAVTEVVQMAGTHATPAGTQHSESDPGFLSQLTEIGSGIFNNVKSVVSDVFGEAVSSVADTGGQFLSDAVAFLPEIFGFLALGDRYNKHLTAVSMGRDYMSPSFVLFYSDRKDRNKVLAAFDQLSIEQYAALLCSQPKHTELKLADDADVDKEAANQAATTIIHRAEGVAKLKVSVPSAEFDFADDVPTPKPRSTLQR